MITVEEFMTSELSTLREADSVDDARRIMTKNHIRHIPIIDSDSHLIGLVTQRDVLAATNPEHPAAQNAGTVEASSGLSLADIMIRDVSTIHTTDSLRKAAIYMQSHKYGCLPVVNNGRLVGIITDSDFIAIAINLIELAELNEEEIGAQDAL